MISSEDVQTHNEIKDKEKDPPQSVYLSRLWIDIVPDFGQSAKGHGPGGT